ncbi:MAG: Rieske 2Fe-2S domain-containing protein [Bacteroidetes bacterium]|nr:Rieske 2Fe-2S domain-containing protein [Bacteroidota bacterium]
MTKTIRLCPVSEVPESKPRCVSAEGTHFAVYRLESDFVVIRDECPHQMASFEGAPCINGTLTCGFHGWVFDLKTGVPMKGFGNLTLYPVRVENDFILIDYHEDQSGQSAYHASFIR